MGDGRLILKEPSKYEIGTYAEIICRNAHHYPDREVFACDGVRLTFSQHNSKINRLIQALLDLGLRKGDVIGALSWNSLEYVEIYGAAMKGGFIISPFNARLKQEELRSLIPYSEAKAIFVGREFLETAGMIRETIPTNPHWISVDTNDSRMLSYRKLIETFLDEEPSIEVKPSDPGFIFFTSGTTGTPKGAVYTHAHGVEDNKTYVMMNGIQPVSRFLMIMPFFHIGGSKEGRDHLRRRKRFSSRGGRDPFSTSRSERRGCNWPAGRLLGGASTRGSSAESTRHRLRTGTDCLL